MKTTVAEKKETITIKDILDGLLSKDSVDALAAIDSAETIRILLGHVASRIEAAVERERVEIRRDAEIEWTRIGYDERKAEEKRAPGNAAAMREALEDTNRLLKHYAERIPMFADAFAQHIRDNDAALKGETK